MTTTTEHAQLCPGCFTAKGNASICPQCGYDESLKRGPLVLPHRTLLHHGQYLIGKVLGKPGGFGITYLALDTKLETRVAIKEYLPRDLAGRDAGHATISAHSAEDGEFFRYGLTQFLQEARTLAQFDHANIVRVRNFFEENGTGYLVMDYYDGITLADYLAQQPQGKLPEKTAVGILMPILDGLREVHAKNILHRDIKPQNIYLTTANRPILLDFGAARQAMGERSRSLSVVLSEGYAPYEQYHRRGEQGPWTDIYACAAVLYHAVAGEAPPPATERMHKDELDIAALGVSAALAEALRLGLAVDHHKRPQRMAEFQALLLGEKANSQAAVEHKPVLADMPATATTGGRTNSSVEPAQGKKPSGLKKWWMPALALFFAIVVQAMFTKVLPKATGSLSQNARLMSIESSDLEGDKTHENQITLNALLRNRATYAQAFPNLELTLNDSQEKPVARRVFLPADYLPPSENEKIGFLPNRELKVKLHLNTADLMPTSYRLFLFYPKQEKEAETTLLPTILLATPENTHAPVAAGAEIKPDNVFKDCPICPEMVVIPSGSFEMGSNNGDADEKPVHRVTISRAFALGKTEITQDQWRVIMGSNPSRFANCGGNCPVEQVSWNDAKEFIQKLNAKTGKQYRLPSEAEWEYACYGGSQTEYCGGNDLDAVGWYGNNGRPGGNSNQTTHPVGQKQANGYGLYDMSGNVWEWMENKYDNEHDWLTRRGGSWEDIPQGVSASYRLIGGPASRGSSLGFRLARTLP